MPPHRSPKGGNLLLGIRSRGTIARRHFAAAVGSLLLVYAFWLSRPEWDPEMRLWRAFGDAAFVYLFLTVALGATARLLPIFQRVLPWRRELGVWFALTGLVHGYLVWDGWARWNVLRLLGYEFVAELGRNVRLDPGFGLANLMGIVALVLALVLAATSSDRAVDLLGIAGWKWLHSFTYVIFYLVALHGVYFLFIHYTLSWHRPVPPPNWFRFYFLAMVLLVPALQTAAFIRTVMVRRRSGM